MQAHNQIKGILGQILQLFGFQWSAKLHCNSRSFPCLCRRCFYQVFRVFPSVWKYCCSWNLLLLFSDWLICVTLRGRRPKYKWWGLILQSAEGSWYPAVVAGAGERVLNLVLAGSLGLVGFDVARDTPLFCRLWQMWSMLHRSGVWAANVGRMGSLLGREGKTKPNLSCAAGGWLTQVPSSVCVHIGVFWGDTERNWYQGV